MSLNLELFFDPQFLDPLKLSLKLATLTCIILLPIGIFLGYILAFYQKWWTLILETLTWLPLLLPPTVLGFYLLLIFSPDQTLGKILDSLFHTKIAFSFTGIVIGSVIFSLPFMINPIKTGLVSLPAHIRLASFTLGKNSIKTLFLVLLPNILPNILLALTATFTHTIGEFGVVLMLGGDIPGITRVASIAIYTQAELLNYTQAHYYSLTLSTLSFTLLILVIAISSKYGKYKIL